MAHCERRRRSTVVLWLLLGCSSPPPSTPRAIVSGARTPATGGAVTALRQTNSGKGSSTVPKAASEPDASRAVAPKAPSSFHFVAIGSVVTADDRVYLYDGDQLVAEVEGTTVQDHPEYLGSYATGQMESVSYAGGKWPDQAYLAVNRPAQRSGYTVLMKKVGKTWTEVTRTQITEWVQAVKPWDRGRYVALVTSMYGYYRWQVVQGAPRTVPSPTRAGADGCCGPTSTAQMPVDFAALPSGDLFAVGSLVNDRTTWVVEHFVPNAKQGTMYRLPLPSEEGLEIEIVGLHANRADDVYAFGQLRRLRANSTYERDSAGGYVAHFDGKSWTNTAIPNQSPVTSVATEAGSLWIVAGGALYRRDTAGGPFELVVLPEVTDSLKAEYRTSGMHSDGIWSLAAEGVQVRAGHDIWVTAKLRRDKTELGSVVLRNREHGALWKGLVTRDYAQTMEQYQPLRPADQYCPSIYVMLYGMTRSTPKNYDYPLTREAVKGHPEFADVVFAETEELGQHYFGAFVPGYELSRKLVKLVATKVPGTKPVALCRNPKKVRLLKFDLVTGTVLENTPLVDPP